MSPTFSLFISLSLSLTFSLSLPLLIDIFLFCRLFGMLEPLLHQPNMFSEQLGRMIHPFLTGVYILHQAMFFPYPPMQNFIFFLNFSSLKTKKDR